MKNIITSAVVSLVVVVFGLSLFGGKTVERVINNVPVLGGTGQDESARKFFLEGASFGGRVATTSAVASYTTSSRDFFNQPTVVSWTPNLNTTVSLSSTSTQGYVPNIGDTATIYLRNASSTAGATITLAAADSGSDLQFTEATGGDLVLNGLDWMKITIIKTSQNLTTFLLDEMTEAD